MIKIARHAFGKRYLLWRAIPSALAAIAVTVITIYYDSYFNTGSWQRVLVDTVGNLSFPFFIGILFATVAFRLRNELALVFRYHNAVHQRMNSASSTKVILSLTHAPLKREFERLTQIVVPPGLVMAKDELGELTRHAFAHCPGPYFGTDMNVPSEFRAIYPLYIEDEIGRERHSLAEDVRFLIVEPSAIQGDYDRDAQEFLRFYDRHWQNQILLMQVDPAYAAAAQRKAGLPSAEFGVYEWRFVLFYSPGPDGKSVRVLAGELTGSLAKQCEMFLDELVDGAKVLSLRDERRPTLTIPNDEYRSHIREIVTS